MVKAVLLKPLDGDPAGSEREFNAEDFKRLEAFGAVRKLDTPQAKKAPAARNKKAPAVQNKSAGK